MSVGDDVGASELGPAKRTRAEKARLFSRRRRLSFRVLFAGRRIDSGGTDFGRIRIARKGAFSSIGCRSSVVGGRGEVVVGLVGRAWLVDRGKFYRVECTAYFTDFEYVGIFGVFGKGDLKRVPEDVVVVQVSIGGCDDATAQ